MKHINVALFVPDEGCPHRCSFCNQKTISGKTNPLKVEDIDRAVEIALQNVSCNEGEIAFFGGSFTAIDKEYMTKLLKRACFYIKQGFFKGIRISTRPDCINEEILEILSFYGVTSIELGCQSMDDRVLALNGRGHTCEDTVKASCLIKNKGFSLGHQMMTGLYGDSDEGVLATAKKLIALKPDTMRIYPTVVLENTELERLYKKGIYVPQTTDDAAELCKRLILMLDEADIKVIRLGLHSGGNVEDGYVAGPYHPAFKEICEGKIYFDKILSALTDSKIKSGKAEIEVGSSFVSMATGHKRCNVEKLKALGYEIKIYQNNEFKKYEVSVRG